MAANIRPASPQMEMMLARRSEIAEYAGKIRCSDARFSHWCGGYDASSYTDSSVFISVA